MIKLKVSKTKVRMIYGTALNIFYWLTLAVLIIVSATAALSATGLPKQLMLFVVQSGSMEPAIKTGSVVFVKPQKDYKVGDIVTFKQNRESDIKNPKLTVTHRIVTVNNVNNEEVFTTRGDANNVEDMRQVSKDTVLGKVLFGIPYLGYPVGFVKTQTGFVLLIVIPATIFVYSEILSIKKEAKRIMEERKKRKLENEVQKESE